MKDVMTFLNGVLVNNNRPWFLENKDLYQKAQNKIYAMAETLISGISKFDSSIKNLSVSDCTYRIYRDIRFSPDKRPYKTHMGIYVCPNGKKSGLAGYYLHFEGDGAEYIGCNGLFTGLWNPDKNTLKSIREDICYDGDAFVDAINKAGNFTLDTSNSLTKNPKDFPPHHKHDTLLRLKQYNLVQKLPEGMLYSDHLIEWALEEFKTSLEFNNLLNRAAMFARE
ncbi:MAG: DUF2461 domain-containing protein [Bacteroidales bacterium]|nr:DUF2461 domain-containing protein [Bacteroidales bacterium]